MTCDRPVDVDSPAHHVRRDQVLDLAGAERRHDLFALRLRQVAVDHRGLRHHPLEVAIQVVSPSLAFDEDQALARLLPLDHPLQQFELLVRIDREVRLADLVHRRRVRRHVQVDRVGHVAVHEPLDRIRHGRRHEERLAFQRAPLQDAFDVRAEPDVEHPVGFVEHDVPDVVEDHRPAARWSSIRPGVPTTRSQPRARPSSCLLHPGAAVDRHGRNRCSARVFRLPSRPGTPVLASGSSRGRSAP